MGIPVGVLVEGTSVDGLSVVTEYGVRFETGKPVTFRFLRNTEAAPNMGARYGQDIEPAGRYMTHRYGDYPPPARWVVGTATFKKPLVLLWNTNPTGGYDATGWKARLATAYKAKKRGLTAKLVRQGYDGIVTTDERGNTKEIVALDGAEVRSESLDEARGQVPAWIRAMGKEEARTFVGPNGNAALGYEWKWMWGQKESKKEGGLVDARVSDWSEALQCSTCGRDIVHVYWIKDKATGEVEAYGVEHLHVALGYPGPVSKRDQENILKKIDARGLADKRAAAKMDRLVAKISDQRRELEGMQANLAAWERAKAVADKLPEPPVEKFTDTLGGREVRKARMGAASVWLDLTGGELTKEREEALRRFWHQGEMLAAYKKAGGPKPETFAPSLEGLRDKIAMLEADIAKAQKALHALMPGKVTNTVVSEGLTLGSTEKKIIDAFAARQPADGKKMSTDGTTLSLHWLGGGDFAAWKGDRVHLRHAPGTSSEDTIVRALEKRLGRETVVPLANPKVEHLHLDVVGEENKWAAVAREGSTVVGVVQYTTLDGRVYIDNIEVPEEHRRRGIASALYKAIKQKQRVSHIPPTMLTPLGAAWRKGLKEEATMPTGVLLEASVTFDEATIKKLRADYLLLMRNVDRVNTESDLDEFSAGVKKFFDYLRAIFLRADSGGEASPFLDAARRANVPGGYVEAWDKALREKAWAFAIGMEPPGAHKDRNPEDHRYRLSRWMDGKKKWKGRVDRAAREFWKELDYVFKAVKGWNRGQPLDVQAPTEPDVVTLEGVKVIVRTTDGTLPNPEKWKAAFRLVRQRTTQVFPWMWQHRVPIHVMDLGLDRGGQYLGGRIDMDSTPTGGPEQIAGTYVHEMGHHIWRVILSPADQRYWRSAYDSKRMRRDLRDLLAKWPADEVTTYGWAEKVQDSDPVLALHLHMLASAYGNRGRMGDIPGLWAREDAEKMLADGQTSIDFPAHPITAYAAKNEEEAFCEALKMTVAYGPRTLHPLIAQLLKDILGQRIRIGESLKERDDYRLDTTARVKVTPAEARVLLDQGGTVVNNFLIGPMDDALEALRASMEAVIRTDRKLYAALAKTLTFLMRGMRWHESVTILDESPVEWQKINLKAKYDEFNRKYFGGVLPSGISLKLGAIKGASATTDIRLLSKGQDIHRLRFKNNFSPLTPEDADIVVKGIKFSTTHAYEADAFDGVMLHEMIHVHLAVTGWPFEQHGKRFTEEAARVSRLAGIVIPLTHDVSAAEVTAAEKEVGVLIAEPKNPGEPPAYLLFAPKAVEAFKAQAQKHVDSLRRTMKVYLVRTTAWANTTVKQKPERFGLTMWKLDGEQAKRLDLKQGKLLATFEPKPRTPKGEAMRDQQVPVGVPLAEAGEYGTCCECGEDVSAAAWHHGADESVVCRGCYNAEGVIHKCEGCDGSAGYERDQRLRERAGPDGWVDMLTEREAPPVVGKLWKNVSLEALLGQIEHGLHVVSHKGREPGTEWMVTPAQRADKIVDDPTANFLDPEGQEKMRQKLAKARTPWRLTRFEREPGFHGPGTKGPLEPWGHEPFRSLRDALKMLDKLIREPRGFNRNGFSDTAVILAVEGVEERLAEAMVARGIVKAFQPWLDEAKGGILQAATLDQARAMAKGGPFKAPHYTAPLRAVGAELKMARGGVFYMRDLPDFSKLAVETVAYALKSEPDITLVIDPRPEKDPFGQRRWDAHVAILRKTLGEAAGPKVSPAQRRAKKLIGIQQRGQEREAGEQERHKANMAKIRQRTDDQKRKALTSEAVLAEAAKGIADLPPGIGVRIRKMNTGSLQVMYWHTAGARRTRKGDEANGVLMLARSTKHFGPCDDAWMIEWAEAMKGWGPLLYDVAVEVATKLGGGLMADRKSVSDDAHKVWMFYMHRRPDVKVHQLDDIETPHLTGRPDDDCVQKSAKVRAKGGEKADADAPEKWSQTPESKRITKDNATTLKALAAAGLLTTDGVSSAKLGV